MMEQELDHSSYMRQMNLKTVATEEVGIHLAAAEETLGSSVAYFTRRYIRHTLESRRPLVAEKAKQCLLRRGHFWHPQLPQI